MLIIKVEPFTNKPQRGYIRKKTIENEDVDQKLTDQWSTNKYISSHFEVYTCTIHEQEKNNQQPTNDNKCHLYKIHVENVTHIIRSCCKMSSRYYLPIWHDVIAKYLYEAIRRSKDPKCKIEYTGNEFIDQDNETEYWWNVAIKTAVKVRYYSARPCEKFSSLVSADRDI